MERGINVGSRRDFERLCAFVEAKGIRFDAIIAREFDFLQAPAAFRHLQEGDFIGKVIINIPGC
jgi:D-arabinose 1-dehydrogenase-like Zn-dependent alcohol dehydrogenase